MFFADSSLDVLTAARDAVHQGWEMTHHPLYGNFRPHQQPYRSLILRSKASFGTGAAGTGRVVADEMSLHLVEEALVVYQSVPVLVPSKAPAALRDACTILDFELLRESLLRAGWPSNEVSAVACANGLA